jgi:hypothetical protein
MAARKILGTTWKLPAPQLMRREFLHATNRVPILTSTLDWKATRAAQKQNFVPYALYEKSLGCLYSAIVDVWAVHQKAAINKAPRLMGERRCRHSLPQKKNIACDRRLEV